jgi:CubicO group peptidase (beta-lactamase class C family)
MQPVAHSQPAAPIGSLAELACGGLTERAQVIVLRGGEVVAEEYAGAGVGAATRFLLWSLSKPMTAAAVLVLVDRGSLELDQPVCSVLPAFAARGKDAVTVRDVLLHRGGFVDMLPGDPPEVLVNMTDFADWDQAVAKICDLPLRREWFGRSTYHATAYGILGAVVERASGMRFADFTQETVFDPLGMTATTWGLPTSVRDVALPALDDDSLSALRVGVAPAGNVWSTASDMSKFFRMLRAGGSGDTGPVLSASAVAGMTTGQSDQEGSTTLFGFGTMVDSPKGPVFARGSRGSRTSYGHSGTTAVQAWHDPGCDLTMIALTDSLTTQEASNARFDALSDAVYDRYVGEADKL